MNITNHVFFPLSSKVGQYYADGTLASSSTNSNTLFYSIHPNPLRIYSLVYDWINRFGSLNIFKQSTFVNSTFGSVVPSTNFNVVDGSAVSAKAPIYSVILY